MVEGDEVLRLEQVATHFPVPGRLFGKGSRASVRAVDGVDLVVRKGQSYCLVGESGCGKSTLARTIVRLERPSRGRILFDGNDITHASTRELRSHRRNLQLVFQNPYGSLNPRMRVERLVAEPLITFGLSRDASEIRLRVGEMLEQVGLEASHATRFPHEFSGGQRQRVAIARALIMRPKMLVLDEPVSALDVSIQAQILGLLQDLQTELGLTYMMISHDLAVVRHLASHVGVMYLGKIIETGPSQDVYECPVHPYTKALLSAVPDADTRGRSQRRQIIIEGEIPSPMDPPSGCRFRTRCWKADATCESEEPELVPRSGSTQAAACHHGHIGEEHSAKVYV